MCKPWRSNGNRLPRSATGTPAYEQRNKRRKNRHRLGRRNNSPRRGEQKPPDFRAAASRSTASCRVVHYVANPTDPTPRNARGSRYK